jgi:DNA-binding transcriptional MerR regulator
VIRLCKAVGFGLEEIQELFADEASGRPATRALGEAKLASSTQGMAELAHVREIIRWGMRCTCRSIDACICGIQGALLA